MRSLRDDRTALVEGLRLLDPDVFCLQEVPRFLGGRRSWHRLVAAAGLRPVVGGRPGAVALCVRPGTTTSDVCHLRLSRTRGLHQRGAVAATVDGVRVVGVHLGLDAAERRRHTAELAALGADLLAGDLNEDPALVAAALGLADHPTGPTFPAGRADRRIDAVLTNLPGVVSLPEGVDWARATDHVPVLCVAARA